MDNRQDRELEVRSEFLRADSWKPASLLPEFKKVPGWAYRWIRTSLLNEADNLNVSTRMREGWEPVKLADHPEMKLMVDQNSRFKEGVEIGGLLLCKIPEEFVAQRKAHYATQAKQQAEQTARDEKLTAEQTARTQAAYAQTAEWLKTAPKPSGLQASAPGYGTIASIPDNPVTGAKGGWYANSGTGWQLLGAEGQVTGPVIPYKAATLQHLVFIAKHYSVVRCCTVEVLNGAFVGVVFIATGIG
jgi:hypothetical protein